MLGLARYGCKRACLYLGTVINSMRIR